MLALLGTLVGALLSLPIILYFHYYPIVFGGEYAEIFEKFGYEPILPFSTDPVIFYQQVKIILLITVVLSGYPLWKIYRLKVVEAMRE